MSTKMLLILGFVCIIVAGYFYKSGDSHLSTMQLKASDIDYQASNIKAMQTNETGNIHYQMTATGVTHYQNARSAVLENPNITLYNQQDKKITLTAGNANFDENTQIVQLTNHVKVVSQPKDAQSDSQGNNSNAPMTLTTDAMVGDLKNKKIMSQAPVNVVQNGNTFDAKSMYGDVATGDYQFEQVAMTFLPPNR